MGRSFAFLLTAAFFFFMASCEDTESCKECDRVTYDGDGNEVDRTDEGEYCGEALDDKEDEEGEVGNQSYEYECTS